MSLVLTDAGEKLEITAASTIPFTVHYADYVGATPVFTPGVAGDDTIVGTKDLLAAPGSGQRVVRTITVFNDSGGADTITIQLDDGGVNYTIVTAALPDDHALYYDEDGWKVLDDTGSILTSLVGNTTQHNILSSSHADAATDAVTRGSIIVGNATPAWDELVHPGTAYHLQTDPTDVVWSQHITMADDAWIGIGAALERIVFDAAGDISVMGATLGVGTLVPVAEVDIYGNLRFGNAAAGGALILSRDDAGTNAYRDLAIYGNDVEIRVATVDEGGISMTSLFCQKVTGFVGVNNIAPAYRLDVIDDIANYAAKIFNDGNADDHQGLIVQCGADANPAGRFVRFTDGDASAHVGWVIGDGAGGVTYFSASDVRLKNVLGPVDKDIAMEALTKINPIHYVGKGLTAETGRKNVGFSAQAIHEYFPEVATYDEESGSWGISYERLVPVLWATNQMLLARIEDLERKVA